MEKIKEKSLAVLNLIEDILEQAFLLFRLLKHPFPLLGR